MKRLATFVVVGKFARGKRNREVGCRSVGKNEMKYLLSLITLLLFVSPGLTQTIVLDAKPAVQVESGKDSTKRFLLSNTEQEKYRVRIIKNGPRYLWASRENRELVHHLSGAFHFFIDPLGGGYVKVFDNSHLPNGCANLALDFSTWST